MCNQGFGLQKWSLRLLYSMCALLLSAQSGLDTPVQKLAQKAFAQKSETAVRLAFEQGLDSLPTAQAKGEALSLLAVYESYNGSYAQAAAHYRQAAALNTDSKTELLLEAVRMLLCGGYFDSSRSLLSEIAAELPVNTENAHYRTAAVYDAWRLLAEDRADRALPLITAYAANKSFSDYHAALLFTLWWVNGDEKAKERLLKEYPSCMEAAAVQGAATVQPSAFWYLMPKINALPDSSPPAYSGVAAAGQQARTSAALAQSDSTSRSTGTAASSLAAASHTTSADSAQAKPLYYQLGFYKTKKYAERLVEELEKKQFRPVIKEETRPSGTVYFAVLVEENTAGDIMLKLKDAGYEAFPVFP